MIKQWFEGLSKEYNSSAWNLWASRYNWDNILNTNQLNNGSKDLQNGWGGNGGLQEGGNQVWLNRNTLEGGANAGGGERALSSLWDNQGGTRSSWKSVVQETNPERVRQISQKLQNENPKGAFMDVHSVEDYSTYKNFISSDGNSAISVKPDWDITNFISNWKVKGQWKELMFSAIENWGIKMDNYWQWLVRYYEKFWFEPVAKVKFNPEYAPDGWNFPRDKQPDIYVMLHNGDDLKTVRSKYWSYQEKLLKDLPTLDYDEALKYRDTLLESRKQGLGKLRDWAETSLHTEARKYKAAEEFWEAMEDLFIKNEVEISTIQRNRHNMHSMDEWDFYNLENWGIDKFDDTINQVIETMDSVDIPWLDKEKYINKLKEISIPDDASSISDIDLDLITKDSVSKEVWNAISEDWFVDPDLYESYARDYYKNIKEKANNIIESYLVDLDEISDNIWMQKDKQYAPSWFARARSLLWEWTNNITKNKYFENKLNEIREKANSPK